MKIHWCCGDVYLDGYVNVDIHGLLTSQVKPEQIEANRTTIERYYRYPFIEDAVERRKSARPFILDLEANIMERWPFEDGSVDGFVLVNAAEHFTRQEFAHIQAEIQRTARIGCQFIVSFPDIPGIIREYYDTNPEHCMTLIYCNWKNAYSQHKTGFTEKTFAALFPGWMFESTSIINHDYPSIQLIGTKTTP
jgi:hypothetical protein